MNTNSRLEIERIDSDCFALVRDALLWERSFWLLDTVGAAAAGATVGAPIAEITTAATGVTRVLDKLNPWSNVPSRGHFCTAVCGAANGVWTSAASESSPDTQSEPCHGTRRTHNPL